MKNTLTLKTLIAVFTFFIFISCNSISESGIKLSKNEFGEKWPLTVDEGTVDCVDGSAVIFIVNGKKYAVNGLARNRMKDKGYLDINEIWKENPLDKSIKLPISPILDAGLEICK